MGKRSKQPGQGFEVWPAEGGRQSVRRTSLADGLRCEEEGTLRSEFCSVTGARIGFRVVGYEMRRIDSDMKSMPSSASISANEMAINATGHSRTYGLGEDERKARIKSGLPAEDRVERVKAKVRVYAVIGAAKGDILRVWPR